MKFVTKQSTLFDVGASFLQSSSSLRIANLMGQRDYNIVWKMNATNTWNTNASSIKSLISPTRPYHDKVDYNVSDVYKFIFGGIAIGSFLGNFLLCVAICRRRSLLSKMYNMLVLSLAITDMLTG